MTEGYVDAGKLEVQVVADLRAFKADLKSKLAAETKGVEATVGIKLDTSTIKAQIEALNAKKRKPTITAAVKVDTSTVKAQIEALNALKRKPAVTATVKMDTSTVRAQLEALKAKNLTISVGITLDTKGLKAQLAAAAKAAGAINVPADPGGGAPGGAPGRDPADPAKARDKLTLAEAHEQLAKSMRGARSAALDLESAQRRLLSAERDSGKESEKYRRAQLAVAEAEDRRTKAIARAKTAVEDLAAVKRPVITAQVQLDRLKALAELKELSKDRKVTLDVDVDKGAAKAKAATEKLAKGASSALSSVLSGIGAAGMPAIIAGAVPAVTALAGAAAALGGAIGPAVYSLGLIPAAAGAGAVAIATLTIGFQGFGGVMKAIASKDLTQWRKAIKDLTPAAREVATTLAQLGPVMSSIRKGVQETLLKGLAGPIKTLAGTYLGPGGILRTALEGTAKSFNFAFKDTMSFLSSAKTTPLVAAGMRQVNEMGKNLARTFRPLTAIFVNLFATGAPFVTRITKGLADMLGKVNEMGRMSRLSDWLADAFERSFTVIKSLGRILRDTTIGLVKFFGAGESTGLGFLGTIEKVAAKFRAFASSAQGQEKFRAFFDDVRVVMAGLGAVIGWATQRVLGLVALFHSLPEPVRAAIAPLLLLAGGVALLLTKLAPLIGVLARFGPMLAAIGGGGAATTIAAIAGPLLLLAGAFVYAYTQVKSFRDLISVAFTTVRDIAMSVFSTVQPIFTMIGSIFTDIVKPAIDRVIDTFSQKLLPVLAYLKEVYDSKVQPALADLVQKFKDAEPQIRTFVGWITNAVELLAGGADTGPMTTAIDAVAWALETTAGNVGMLIGAFASLVDFMQTIPGRFHALAQEIQGFYDSLPAPLKWIIEHTPAALLPKALEGYSQLASKIMGGGGAGSTGSANAAEERARREAAGGPAAPKKKGPPVRNLGPGVPKPIDFGKLPGTGTPFAGFKDTEADKAAKKAEAERKKREAEAAKRAEAVRGAVQAMANKGFIAGLTSTIAQIRSAARQMVGFAKTALGKGALPITDRIYADTNRLTLLAGQRDAIIKKLTTAQDKLKDLTEKAAQTRAQIAEKIRSTFDLLDSSAGQGAQSMIDRLSKAVEAAKTFTASVAALKARGLNAALLGQLAAGGPAAQGTANTLTQATGAELNKINQLYTQLDQQAVTGGQVVADALFGAGIQAAQGLVNGLLSQRKAVEASMLTIATALQNAVKAALKIKSPSEVMLAIGGDTMAGLQAGLLGPTAGITLSLTKWATDTMTSVRGAFTTGVAGIGAAWQGIVEATNAPIRTVIEVGINQGIIAAYNAVAAQFGVKGATPVTVPKALMATQPVKRSTGGPIFGAGTATSDSIPALLSTGEHVLAAREVTGLGGHRAVEMIRAAARSGRATFAAGGGLSGSGPATFPSMVAWLKQYFPQARASTYQPSFGYHRSSPGGYAADIFAPGVESGGAGAMAVFEGIRRAFHDRIQELIYTWAGGRQVWNGRDFTFTGAALQASHRTHIHWSMLADGFAGGAGALLDPVREAISKGLGALAGRADLATPFGKVLAAGAGQLGNRVAEAGQAKLNAGVFGDPAAGITVPGVGSLGLPASVTRWAPTVLAVLKQLGQPASNLSAVLRRINFESSGRPDAVNLTDSNARKGTPSRGLMQTIGCVTVNTMILTRRGWLKHDEVQTGDETLGFNPATGHNEWTPVTAVLHYEDAEVWRIGHSNWSVEVTPNHRWWSETEYTVTPETLTACPECGWAGRAGRNAPAPTLRSISTHRGRAHGARNTPTTAYRGEFVTTDTLDKRHRIRLAAPATTGEGLPITPAEAAILAWAVGDGHIRTPGDITIYQSKIDGVAELRRLLTDVPHGSSVRQRAEHHLPAWTFRLRRAYAQGLLARSRYQELGPEAFVLALDPGQRAAWLDAMIRAEGHRQPGKQEGYSEFVRIAQVNGPVQDAIKLAVYLSGARPTFSPNAAERNGYQPAGTVGMAKPFVAPSTFAPPEILDRQPVWCVTTGLGTWTALSDGLPFLTGNSTFAAHAGRYAGRGITDPFANIFAGLHYAIGRYGSIAAIDPLVRPRGYDKGGWLNPGQLGINTGRKPEAVLSSGEFGRLVSALETTANRPMVVAGRGGGLGTRSLASLTVPSQRGVAQQPGTAGGAPVINVYPRAAQSEAEIARGVSRELAWQGTQW